ncbi:MAG: ABC transporter substrate-binding protein [Acidilobaceae archaeon]|nr:ABC transporter substrate-binding protein [Acidilobaceae archaeon]
MVASVKGSLALRAAVAVGALAVLIAALLVAPSFLRGPEAQPTPTAPATPAPTLPAPSPTQPQQPAGPVTLTIITRHPGEIQLAAKNEFLKSELAKRYNIVDVEFYTVDPVAWVSAIQRRGDFDIAWGGGPTLFDSLLARNLLSPLEGDLVASAIAQIPDTIAGAPMKRVIGGKAYWVAASIASFGFTVNADVLKKYGLRTPTSWKDLGSPELARPLVTELKPMVSIADATRSTSHTRMYQIILQAYGWERGWVNLTAMAANSLIEGGSTEARDNVIAGKVAVAITIDFFGYTAMQANPATKYIIPPGETIINGDPIALLTTSKNPEAAKAFIAWALTEGQKIWFRSDINRLPSNPKAFELPEGAVRKDLKEAFEAAMMARGMPFDDEKAMRTERAMQAYFKATLVDLDNLLKEAWRTLVKAYFDRKIDEAKFKEYLRRLGEPLEFRDPTTGRAVKFTEEEAAKITSAILADPRLEESYMREWRRAAEKRYTDLIAELRRLG